MKYLFLLLLIVLIGCHKELYVGTTYTIQMDSDMIVIADNSSHEIMFFNKDAMLVKKINLRTDESVAYKNENRFAIANALMNEDYKKEKEEEKKYSIGTEILTTPYKEEAEDRAKEKEEEEIAWQEAMAAEKLAITLKMEKGRRIWMTVPNIIAQKVKGQNGR